MKSLLGGSIDGCRDVWIIEFTDRWFLDGWMDVGWVDERIGGWLDGW
jgi:hypothetical protein